MLAVHNLARPVTQQFGHVAGFLEMRQCPRCHKLARPGHVQCINAGKQHLGRCGVKVDRRAHRQYGDVRGQCGQGARRKPHPDQLFHPLRQQQRLFALAVVSRIVQRGAQVLGQYAQLGVVQIEQGKKLVKRAQGRSRYLRALHQIEHVEARLQVSDQPGDE